MKTTTIKTQAALVEAISRKFKKSQPQAISLLKGQKNQKGKFLIN